MNNVIDQKIDTYCHKDFIDHIDNALKEKYFVDLITDKKEESIFIIMKLFSENSNLYISSNITDLFASNTFFKLMFKHGTCNAKHIEEDTFFKNHSFGIVFKINKSQDEKNIPCTFHLNDWSEKILGLSRQISLKVDQYSKINEFLGWSFLLKVGIPVNAAIIVDRYAFKNVESIKSNITDLLVNLIPRTISEDFHLTIITQENQSINPSEIKKILLSGIKSQIKDIHIDLSVYLLKNIPETHDRRVITNYYTITCGNSFAFYSNRGGKRINVSTRVTLTPVLFRNEVAIELEQIRYLCSMYKARIEGRNRLLKNGS